MDISTNESAACEADVQEKLYSYTYFVAYTYQGRVPNSVGHANNSITRPTPITSYEDVVEIQNALLAANPEATKVIILNWQLLQTEEGFPPKQQWRTGFEPVHDSQGPFSVVSDEGTITYSHIPTFTKASILAEANAIHGDGEAFFVRTAAGQQIAGFIRPDECIVVVDAGLDESPAEISDLSAYLKENVENTYKFGSRAELLAHLVEEAGYAKSIPSYEAVRGIREFKINEDHRMFDMTPSYQVVFYQFDGKFALGDNLPEDIRAVLERFVS